MATLKEPIQDTESYTITLKGSDNQSLEYGINGVHKKLPCGVELTVDKSVYEAVKSHIIERN